MIFIKNDIFKVFVVTNIGRVMSGLTFDPKQTIELYTNYAPRDPDEIEEACVTHTAVNLYVCERSWTFREKIGV